MKKVFAIIFCIFLMTATLSGCGEVSAEVSREPIDVKYTEAYSSVETEYEYKYNVWKGEFQLVPVVKTVHHDEGWEIQYLITYAAGNQDTEWCSCTEEEYNRVKSELMLDEQDVVTLP